MKKRLITHFTFVISLFALNSIVRGWLDIAFWPFWIGGILGTLLPDIDHLIYIYFLRPHELTSQRVSSMISKGDALKSAELLSATDEERHDLIVHTAYFQLLFLVFAFLVVTSSGSLLGRGIVLAFLLHLVIDQITDLIEKKNIDRWFLKIPVVLDERQKKWYVVLNLLALLLLGFVF